MQWPNGMEPEQSNVHARNEIEIPAPSERIWRWLCRAERWPEWYGNCGWIRFRNNEGPDLQRGTSFVWKTFGVRVRSKVLVYEPALELGWDATAFGLRAYHGWRFESASAGHTRVVTEETQVGRLTGVGSWYLRRGLMEEP